ncbi:MAG: DUF6159 family protein [Acidimicrobiia bacterium]
MTRFQTSWEIAKRSWAVLKSDKSLAWFPVLSFIASLVVFGAFAGLVALVGVDSEGTKDALQPVGWVLIALGYLALAFVQTYFLAGLVAGADQRLHGGDSSVRGALDVANSRLHRLLPWALVSATVTIILNQLERQGIIGQIVASLVGLAWSLVTFLTIPILVIEDIGVGAALKRSKDLFKKTWGENVVGQAGLGIIGFLAMLPGFLVIGIGVATGSVVITVVIGAVGVAWIIVASTVVAALSGIYRTALYRFASTGVIPQDFSGIDFQGAFRPRRINPRGMFGGGNGGGTGGINPNSGE